MKSNKSNIDVFCEETLTYVQKYITSNDLKVLEVGCGAGDFSLMLIQAGIQLSAYDMDKEAVSLAREKGVPAFYGDFLSIKDEVFDVILFTRSLHHIHQLKEAIQHSSDLLVSDGVVIIEDFDMNAIDVKTARWYYDTRSIVSICTNNIKPSEYVMDPMQTWINDHNHIPPLNSGDDMIKEVQDKFNVVSIERNAYLYRSICGKLDLFKDSYRITKKILEIENGLINKQLILPNGLRIVANKKIN